ncbi:MAG TPA: mannose-1-phosphate guanylyltransferase [Thermaerobacter sp.]
MAGHKRVAVILAGGEGRRLWSASTAERPKQFLRLFGDRTLLEATWERARAVPGVDDVWLVTGQRYGELTRATLPGLPAQRLVLEPSARNTAPALALVAGLIERHSPDATVLVLPADHHIPDVEAFAAAADLALRVAAEEPALVTFGIEPTRPETNYGYLELGDELAPGVARVRGFVEKPDADRAMRFLLAGHFAWNSGMFAWRNGVFLDELRQAAPPLHELARAVAQGREWRTLWEQVPAISVDYAVMERSRRIVAVRGRFAWDDLGSWLAVERHVAPAGDGNVALGRGPVRAVDAGNNTVYSEELPVLLLGVRGLLVAATRSGLLVAEKGRLDGLREALQALEAAVQQAAP